MGGLLLTGVTGVGNMSVRRLLKNGFRQKVMVRKCRHTHRVGFYGQQMMMQVADTVTEQSFTVQIRNHSTVQVEDTVTEQSYCPNQEPLDSAACRQSHRADFEVH